MKKKGLIIAIVLILIFAIVGGVAAFILLNKDEEDSKKSKNLEWGDVYLEVLGEDDEFEDLDDMELQLIDMDGDETPELVVYGINRTGDFLAKIYRINGKNKVDTVIVDLQEEFEVKFLYNIKDEVYGWYAVVKETMQDTSSKNSSSNSNSSSSSSSSSVTTSDVVKVYDLNFTTEEYEPVEIEGKFEDNFVEIEMPEIEKIPFAAGLDKEEIEEIFEDVKDNYVTEDDIVTEEVKEIVENVKMVKNISKVDSSKDLVYSALSLSSTWGEYEYPVINLDSDDVKKINDKIKEDYGFDKTDFDMYGFVLGPENVKSSYFYQINGDILSLVVYNGGNESIWASAYNVNLKTQQEPSSQDLLNIEGLKKEEVLRKTWEAAEKEFYDVIEKDKNGFSSTDSWNSMYPESTITEWKQELKDEIDEFDNLYFDENGDLCMLVTIHNAGGQWSCYMKNTINISQGYTIRTLEDEVFGGNLNATAEDTSSTSTTTSTNQISSQLTKYTLDSSIKAPVKEGVYEGPMGTLTISNAKDNQFNFSFECYKPTVAGSANIGMLDGVAQTIQGGNYVYHEYTGNGEYDFTYNIFFYIADGSITIKDECLYNKETTVSTICPYCGNGVEFDGIYFLK